jgi:hypothetical protein
MLTGEKRPEQKKIRSATTTLNAGLGMVNLFVNGHSPPDKRVQLKRKVASPYDGVDYIEWEIFLVLYNCIEEDPKNGVA